ncbi:MAG TPA: DEDD exonuclease domain-containing protein [Acidimicrobiales bacterium]|nr:DEDD exonuclease domain-containing protein [Acidimicrobiales bacterium]
MVAPDTRQARQTRRARRRAPGQGSLDDLGTPLIDVTFCVLDLETTGGSAVDDAICEIGAIKVRGGECLGTFHTFVDPGRDIPPAITVLTGLTTAMVRPAPRIEEVLPSLLEFLGDAVFVGHNVRFDKGFLEAALLRSDRPGLDNAVVDTCALARRLVRDEVPNCKLGTLAERLRLDHRPTHRALDDALATADLLHLLLERAAGFGVATLDDLLELPTAAAHPQAKKLALTSSLPRSPGVYLFRDATGRVLYVGKASDLRSRVRSYFSSDTRRKVGGLLRETASIDHIVTGSALEAAVTEIRLIHDLLPRYNRHGTTWKKAAYLKLTDEAYPRLSVVKRVRDDAATYLGPLSSAKVARRVAEAVESALPVRRCTADPAREPREAPCAPAQLGVAACPCAGGAHAEGYGAVADAVRRALTDEPHLVLEPLLARMHELAGDERYEEAADVRDRAAAFADAHRRVRRFDLVHRAGRLVVRLGRHRAVIEDGRLRHTEEVDRPSLLGLAEPTATAGTPARRWIDPAAADEITVLAGWLDRHAHRLEIEHCEGTLCSPLPRLPELRGR